MRNLLFSLLGILIFFTACSNEDTVEIPGVKPQSIERFYGVKTPDLAQSRGVAQRKKLWYPGTKIDIKFLNGSADFRQKVKEYAAEWEHHAFIFFNFIEEGNADVRIAFDSNDGQYITWSTIGTDCKMVINQSEATMNFVDWNYLSERDKKGDVLRAFGQVLGLELEHRHLNFEAGWQANIASYWESTLTDIPWEQLKQLVIDPLERSQVLETDEYDEESIMIWPFPRQFATNTARDFNTELSAKDIEFIAGVYPKEEVVSELIASFNVDRWYGIDRLEIVKPVTIDWGYGTYETFQAGVHTDIYHEYWTTGSPSFEIYGERDAIVSLSFPHLRGFDISKCDSLKNLSLDFFAANVLDLRQNENLENLSARSGYYSNILIPKSQKLQTLNLAGTRNLYSIDLSGCTHIKTIDVSSCGLTSLNTTGNYLLETLKCFDNQIETLNITPNPNLTGLYCFNNNITSLNISSSFDLAVLQAENNPITEIGLSFHNNKLEVVNISNTPLIENESKVSGFVYFLPNRMGAPEGIFFVTKEPSQNIKDLIYPELENKNWIVY